MSGGPDPGVYELLESVRGGDRGAERAFYETLYLRVYRWALRTTPVRTDEARAWAEDVAAETIARVHRALADCGADSDGEVLAWVYRVAQRAAIDTFRQPSARVRRLCRADPEAVANDFGSYATTDAKPDADDRVLARISVELCNRLAAPLPELFWGWLVGGRSWAEQGGVVGSTEDGARRRVQRARHRLRRLIVAAIEALPASDRDAARRALARRGDSTADPDRP